MDEMLKQFIETGKTPNEILKEKLRANNIQWSLIIFLSFIIWIGYIIILHNRYDSKIKEHSKCDSVHKVDRLTIDIQKHYLDSAVYFKDIN